MKRDPDTVTIVLPEVDPDVGEMDDATATHSYVNMIPLSDPPPPTPPFLTSTATDPALPCSAIGAVHTTLPSPSKLPVLHLLPPHMHANPSPALNPLPDTVTLTPPRTEPRAGVTAVTEGGVEGWDGATGDVYWNLTPGTPYATPSLLTSTVVFPALRPGNAHSTAVADSHRAFTMSTL